MERCRTLLIIIDMGAMDQRDPREDYKVLLNELASYSEELANRRKIVVANKMDLPEAKGNLAKFKRRYKGLEIIPISAMDGIGLEEATEKIHDVLVEEGLYDEGNEA